MELVRMQTNLDWRISVRFQTEPTGCSVSISVSRYGMVVV